MKFSVFGTFACAAVFMASAVFAQSNQITRQIAAGSDFSDMELEWRGLPGGYYFKWNVIAPDGVIEVCGVGTYSNAQTRRASRRILRKAYVVLNDETILTDITFFSEVSRRRQLDGAVANCQSTGVQVPRGNVQIYLGWDGGRARF